MEGPWLQGASGFLVTSESRFSPERSRRSLQEVAWEQTEHSDCSHLKSGFSYTQTHTRTHMHTHSLNTKGWMTNTEPVLQNKHPSSVICKFSLPLPTDKRRASIFSRHLIHSGNIQLRLRPPTVPPYLPPFLGSHQDSPLCNSGVGKVAKHPSDGWEWNWRYGLEMK